MTTVTQKSGAGFLLGDVAPESLTTPERLNEEQRMLRDTSVKFFQSEVIPRIPELEELNPALSKELLKQACEMGLCSIDIPEEYGGLGLDFVSSIQPAETSSRCGGFATTFQVQSVLGLLPILYFSSEEQKQKFLPGIGSGEIVSAYALTEPGSGSDALAAKTTAVLTEDGESWVLNGTKQFITNGGMCDIAVVFAQVDGNQFSAFIVENGTPGFSVGAEEHKMGIKSSSTTTLGFVDCKIPKENLIGEVGWGIRIALNVLNVGRLKLGATGMGAAKEALEAAVKYALERRQFGMAIAEFGIIREKIAEMAARIYASESTISRTAGSVAESVNTTLEAAGGDQAKAMMASLREYNVECAIEKVQGSETQAYCVDEAVQIHGGYGFIEEYKVARLYRDARITRLYEGTNEINRMQISGDVLKRAGKGELTLPTTLDAAADEATFGALASVADQVRRTKVIAARLVELINRGEGGQVEKRGANQELLQRLADIVLAIYGLETAMGRALQAKADGCDDAEVFEAMTQVYASGAGVTVLKSTRESIALMADGKDELASDREELEALALNPSSNVIALRRKVADAIIEREGVWFGA